ncbi:MAG TPA: response regulator transcription factor [Verrucomicrobiae bacterium]
MKARAALSKTRVFLVDDHPIVRRGFQLLLSLEPDLLVCGDADSGEVALDKILASKPDVAIIDLSLKSSSGLELIKQLRAQDLRLKILVFSMHSEAMYEERALRAGANGYITKEQGAEKAIEAIRLLLQGKTLFSPSLAQTMLDRMAQRPATRTTSTEVLTDRELEVLEAIGQGLGSREIAAKFHLSTKTVQSHREHIKGKLGLKHASELVSYAHNWVRDN